MTVRRCMRCQRDGKGMLPVRDKPLGTIIGWRCGDREACEWRRGGSHPTYIGNGIIEQDKYAEVETNFELS